MASGLYDTHRVSNIQAERSLVNLAESRTSSTYEAIWRSTTDPLGTVTVKAPIGPLAPYTLRFPGTQGGAGTTLVNDGLGNLSWGAGGGGVPGICTGTSTVAPGVGTAPVLTITFGSSNPLAGAHVDVRICGVRVGTEVVTFHTMGEASLSAGVLTFQPAFASPTSVQWSRSASGPSLTVFITRGPTQVDLGWTLIVTPTPGTTFTCS